MWDPSTQVTPRQIAHKAHTLACKKLNQSHYDIRQRVLLCNTIQKANLVLKHPSRLSSSFVDSSTHTTATVMPIST